jgi:glycosyltransferase involved in cell wall biosynthesis
MRILHVLPSLDHRDGGPLRVALDIGARCLPLGIESEVLGFGEINLPDNPMRHDRIHALPTVGLRSYVYCAELEAWTKRYLSSFDGVIIHGAWVYPGWGVATTCRSSGTPYAVLPHGMLERWAVYGQGWRKAAKKLAYWAWRERKIHRHARCVLFTTERERNLANSVFRFPSEQVVLTPYGIDESQRPVCSPRDSQLEQDPNRRVALFLSRLHPKKNLEFLINAWHAAAVSEQWRLVIAGAGELSYVNRVKSLVERLGLSKTVQFTGAVSGDDKMYLFQRADWFLLPSKQENFGVVVFEALSNSCPVAISDSVYLSESFRRESEVMPLRLDSWVEFMRNRMVNSEWRNRTLQQDREHLLARFEAGAVARQWADLLREKFCPAV